MTAAVLTPEPIPALPPVDDQRPVLVILNPAAGRGRARAARDRIRGWLATNGVPNEWRESERPGHSAEIAARATRRDHSRVLVVGGDGTIADVVPALVGRIDSPPLAVIPAGTGNDTAKTLGVERLGLERSLEVAIGGREIRLDAGTVNGRLFVNGFGAGLDGAVAASSRRVPFVRGFLPYLVGLGLTLPGWKAFRFDAELDGEALTGGATLVTFANGKVCGGGFRLTPLAEADDGMMDACIVGAHGRAAILYHLPKAFTGRHVGEPTTTYRQVRRVTIEFSRLIQGHVDGNLLEPLRRADLEVLPAALPAVSAL